MKRKGIILAGGLGTRLAPMTRIISKHLLPIYDKPMIFYPISTLMLSGIREILVIATAKDLPLFKELLGDGSQWSINLTYATQTNPSGIAEAFIIAENFLGGAPPTLILGDNFFHGNNLSGLFYEACSETCISTIFAYPVSNPEHYGVIELKQNGEIVSIQEKPKQPKSNLAVTGIYFLDQKATDIAKSIKPSKRNELEITDLLAEYINLGELRCQILGRGFTWLDMGNPDNMLEAANYIQTIQKRQGQPIASLDELKNFRNALNVKKIM